jgi:hypothetical protein
MNAKRQNRSSASWIALSMGAIVLAVLSATPRTIFARSGPQQAAAPTPAYPAEAATPPTKSDGSSIYVPAQIQAHGALPPERQQWADKVRESYNFDILKDNISLPGNAQVEGGDFIQPGAFPTAQYCGHCHQEAYHQWRRAG